MILHCTMKVVKNMRGVPSSSSSSWRCTVLTQILLCFALFIAFNIGDQYERFTRDGGGLFLHLSFISVRGGGIRTLQQQTHLLKQMEKVAKVNDVKFVINISELGEDDPLLQNGTVHFPSLKVPWYTTNGLRGQRKRYFLKRIPLQFGKMLDIIVVDTIALQNYLPKGRSLQNNSDHINWLSRTLEKTDSDWRIVVGYDSLLVCEEGADVKGIKIAYKSLYNVFTRYGVNAYLSKPACSSFYIRKESIAHIGNSSPADELHSSSGSSIISREMQNGFVLHQVGVLEFVSYFINSAGEVMFRSAFHQRGKEYM